MTQRIIPLWLARRQRCSGSFLAVAVAVALPVLAEPVLAESGLTRGPGGETICGPRAKLLARLEHGRDFRAQGQGLRDAEAMMEVRADPDGNWLLVQNYADGLSCLIAMGEAWEQNLPAGAPSTQPSVEPSSAPGATSGADHLPGPTQRPDPV